MPQGVPEMLARSGGWVYYFNGQSGVTLCFGGGMGPIGLCDLFPHHHVKPRTGLVAKHKADVVVIAVGVDEERATEVHSVELIITWWTSKTEFRFCDHNLLWLKFFRLYLGTLTNSNAWIAVNCLQKFFALVTDDPVGVDLRGTSGV